MKNLALLLGVSTVFTACFNSKNKISEKMTKTIDASVPTIGILIFEGFLTNEMVAPLDVFTKKDATGKTLFNVLLIAKTAEMVESEEGLRVLPDCTVENTPALDVLVVPSSFNPDLQVADTTLIQFIKKQNETVDYIASHCAGAFLLGASGVADHKKIVTYCSGGAKLQRDFPNVLVQDDLKMAVVRDGKIISSNGNLVSYIASLDLLEQIAGKKHRQHVEEELLLSKLKQF